VWSLVNRLLNGVFDLLLWPVGWLPVWVQAALVALPAAVFALLVFRWVSDQEGIETAKDRIKAHLLELRLFSDDLVVTLRAQKKILRYNLTYLRHALLPMLVMIVPIILMLVQLESRFAFRGLELGESTILTVEVESEVPTSERQVTLQLPPGVVAETPALRVDQRAEIIWRLRAAEPGQHLITIQVDDSRAEKLLSVSPDGSGVSPSVYRPGDISTLLYPVEPPLPGDSAIRAVHLTYPRARAEFGGLSSASWVFFGASLVFGFALRGAFGVTF
jgi:hypothetical protein